MRGGLQGRADHDRNRLPEEGHLAGVERQIDLAEVGQDAKHAEMAERRSGVHALDGPAPIVLVTRAANSRSGTGLSAA